MHGMTKPAAALYLRRQAQALNGGVLPFVQHYKHALGSNAGNVELNMSLLCPASALQVANSSLQA